MAHGQGLSFDALAVATMAQPAASAPSVLFAWSNGGGLFVQRTSGVAKRIAERCSAGLDLEADLAAVYVACSRAGDERTSEVVLYRLNAQLELQSSHALGRSGRDGRGVVLALRGDEVHVAFHDGSIGEHSVQLATLRGGDLTVRRASRAGAPAAAPALLVYGGHIYLAYAQLSLPHDGRGEARSTIFIARDGAAANAVQSTRVHNGAPTLTADAAGLLLGYRDRSRRSTRDELHVVRLDEQLRVVGSARAIGRANAEGAPSVHGCARFTAALLPREYGRERFVAVNELDRELASVGAGHQFYASGRDFVLASGACVSDSLVLLAADRAAPGKPGVDAVAMRFDCREP